MSKLAFVLAAMIGFGALGCDDEDILDEVNDDQGDIPTTDDSLQPGTPVAPATTVWRATLVDVDTNTNISGDASVLQVEGESSFDASITIHNDTSTCSRPWHVHFGTCATGGGIVGDPAAYPELVADSAGNASATATVATTLDPGQPYHVNVHYSDSQFDRIIACGDLVLQAVVVP